MIYIYIYIYIIGPLTYTSDDGRTTLYGVVSMGGGANDDEDYFPNICQEHSLMVRVSAPRILNWIKDIISKY